MFDNLDILKYRSGILDDVSHFGLSHGFLVVRAGLRVLYHAVKVLFLIC